jgi:hypothetical protein
VKFQKGHRKVGGRKKGAENGVTRDVREFAQKFIDDADYRESLRRRVLRGDAPHMETLIWHYRFGKPKDTLEINQPRPLVVEILADAEAHGDSGPR